MMNVVSSIILTLSCILGCSTMHAVCYVIVYWYWSTIRCGISILICCCLLCQLVDHPGTAMLLGWSYLRCSWSARNIVTCFIGYLWKMVRSSPFGSLLAAGIYLRDGLLVFSIWSRVAVDPKWSSSLWPSPIPTSHWDSKLSTISSKSPHWS